MQKRHTGNVLSKFFWKGVATVAMLCALSSPALAYDTYKMSGTRIFKNNDTSKGWIARGVNMMNQFDRRSSDTNNAGFNVNIVRETIFDFKDVDFGTGTTQEWNYDHWVTLHGVRNLVNDNRANGKVTILCPFSWDGFSQIAGANPYEQGYFNDGSYNNRLYQMGAAFKNDTDVWISTWNEPYGGSWTNDSWYSNQLSMIQAIRNSGNNNPIVVGGTDWANSMQQFLDTGQALLNAAPNTPNGKNIIFDWHAYKYMEWYDQATIEARIQEVKDKNLCMIMGEYGPETGWWNGAPIHIDPTAVQNAVINKKIGGLAWYFKRGNDGNCLVWDDGSPKTDVYNWYYTAKNFLNTMSTVSDPVGGSGSSAPIGRRIGIRAYPNNLYVSANQNNAGLLMASWATTIGTWEQFDVVDAGNGQVALKCVINGKYVTCDLNTSENRLRASGATTIQGWEKFVWEDKGGGVFALKSAAANKYVSCDMGTTDKLLKAQWATTVGDWEKFTYTLQ